MSVNLSSAFCRNRLYVASRNLEKFKAYTELEFGPIGWKEKDYRLHAESSERYRVLPYDEERKVFYTDPEMWEYYEDSLMRMLALCMPGTILEVMLADLHRIRQFSVAHDGRIECLDADMVNPFALFDALAKPTLSVCESGQEA